jgi:ATP-dependent helicase/nuclease subunit A
VLPELDVNLKSQPRQIVVGRPKATDPVEVVCRYASESVQRLLPEKLQRLYEQWPVQVVNESLCLLYVAMTRAVHALHMIVCPRPKEKTHPKTFAGVLRGALAADKPAMAGDILYEHGRSDWDKGERRVRTDLQSGEMAASKTLTIKLKPSATLRRGLERRTPSSLEGGQRIRLEHELRLDTAAALSRGALIHAWLELVDWLEDGPPSDAALEQAARPLLNPGLDVRSEIKRFRKALGQPAIKALLTRDAYGDPKQHGFSASACRLLKPPIDLRAERERSFAVRDGSVLLGGSIDRLVSLSCGGKLIAAEIIDFKTDQVAGEAAIDERIAFYRPQLEAYRGACAKMLRLPLDRILCRIAFIEPGVQQVI